jgi:hypothetical protein
MSDPEKFIDRWSRRKRKAADEHAPVEAKDAALVSPPSTETDPSAAEAPFDPASLPPIESIGAESDIRAFLRPGVPPDLSRAALRRAWSADPAIRDFIGLVENGWDFNNPDAMPGFGPISAGDVAKLLAQVIGAPQPAEPAAQQSTHTNDKPEPTSADLTQQPPQDRSASAQDAAAADQTPMQRSDDIATQNNSDEKDSTPRARHRGHGGALPK